MFGTGFLFLAGGVGAVLGIGGTLGTLQIVKKKKSEAGAPDAETDNTENS